jgi:hypothetical protein
MKLQRLVEMIRQDRSGAEQWPVLVAFFKQNSMGEWQEVDGTRDPIRSVVVDEPAEEVLLVGNEDGVPLSVENLEQELTELLSRHGEFMVDYYGDTPIVLDEGLFHIDVPIGGAGRDEKNRCYLVVCLHGQNSQLHWSNELLRSPYPPHSGE